MRSGLGLLAGFCAIGLLLTPLTPLSRLMGAGGPVRAAAAMPAGYLARGSESGLPLPRFVSLKPKKARMRVGPSIDYATRFVYQAPGLPMEIIQEYGRWRQVRDYDGTSGWMYGALLSGRRTGAVGPWLKTDVALRVAASAKAAAVAMLQPRVRLQLSGCDGHWCRVHLSGARLSGYVRQVAIWGAYPGEIFG